MLTTQINMPRRLNIHAASAIRIISKLGLPAAGENMYNIRKRTTESATMPRRTTRGKVRRKRGRAFRNRTFLLLLALKIMHESHLWSSLYNIRTEEIGK